jgi:hypothetical protein
MDGRPAPPSSTLVADDEKRGENGLDLPELGQDGAQQRGTDGRFGNGNQAARGHGRPPKPRELVMKAREMSMGILIHFGMMGMKAKTGAEVQAGKIVLQYGLGMPKQSVELSGPDGDPLVPTMNDALEKLRGIVKQAEGPASQPEGALAAAAAAAAAALAAQSTEDGE